MEPLHLTLPGYRINEYLLVLRPHEELWNRIQKTKEEFAARFKVALPKFTKPHIALVNFVTWEMMEDKIQQRLHAIAMGIAPFKVELKDYGSYPSHTIFIHVTSKLPIQNLVRELKGAQQLMKLNSENKPHFMEDPHITIALRLKPCQYEQGWLEYAHRHFTARFIAGSMLLLKRPAGEKSAYQIARRFEFMNLPVTTKQASLFV